MYAMSANQIPRPPLTTRVKLTLHTDKRFFGPGICELLERIRKTGSIKAAAAEMEMSYTKAWRILNRAEQELGFDLIARTSGGRNGGNSQLTEAGEKAVTDYRRMEAQLAEFADRLLKTCEPSFMPEDCRAVQDQQM
jgi:molybdate transport system regulatory protein